MPGSASACSRVSATPGTSSSEMALINGRLVIRQGVHPYHDRPVLPLVVAAEPDRQEEALDPQPATQPVQIVLLVMGPLLDPPTTQRTPFEIRDRHSRGPIQSGPGHSHFVLFRVIVIG